MLYNRVPQVWSRGGDFIDSIRNRNIDQARFVEVQ